MGNRRADCERSLGNGRRAAVPRVGSGWFVRVPVAVLGGLFFVGTVGQEAVAKKRAPKLTCSYIAKQCVVGCSKEAPGDFCGSYCSGQRNMCLRTGEWRGMRRTFVNVVRR